MKTLFEVLMSWAVVLSGYPAPGAIPEVVAVPPARIAAEVCGGARCAAVAWLAPGADRVYVDARIDLEHDTQAQAYLVHEFVHYLQRRAGKLHEDMDCAARRVVEREAYGVQARFLAESGEGGGVPAVAASLLDLACRDAPRSAPVVPAPPATSDPVFPPESPR